MRSDSDEASLADDLFGQLVAFRASGDEFAALKAIALLAELPRAEWAAVVSRAAGIGATRSLSVLADLAAGVASGASGLPDTDGWRAVWSDVR